MVKKCCDCKGGTMIAPPSKEKYFYIESDTIKKGEKVRASRIENVVSYVLQHNENVTTETLIELKSIFKKRFLPAGKTSWIRKALNKIFLLVYKNTATQLDALIEEKWQKDLSNLDYLLKNNPIFRHLTPAKRKNIETFLKTRAGSDETLIEHLKKGSTTELLTHIEEYSHVLDNFSDLCGNAGVNFSLFRVKPEDESLPIEEIRSKRYALEKELSQLYQKKDSPQWNENQYRIVLNHINYYARLELNKKLVKKKFTPLLESLEAEIAERVHRRPFIPPEGFTFTQKKHPDLVAIPHYVLRKNNKELVVIPSGGNKEPYFFATTRHGLVPTEPTNSLEARLFLAEKLFFLRERDTLATLFTFGALQSISEESKVVLERIASQKEIDDPTLLAVQLRAAYFLKNIDSKTKETLKTSFGKYQERESSSKIHLKPIEKRFLNQLFGEGEKYMVTLPPIPPKKTSAAENLPVSPPTKASVEKSPLDLPSATTNPFEEKALSTYREYDALCSKASRQDEGRIDTRFKSIVDAVNSKSRDLTHRAVSEKRKALLDEYTEKTNQFFGKIVTEGKAIPSLSLLMVLHARGSLRDWLTTFNPRLQNFDEVQNLFFNILDLEQEKQKLERFCELIPQEEVFTDTSSLLKTINATRVYDETQKRQFPQYQVFEIFINSFLLENQIATLNKFSETVNSTLAQLLMGGGKTFALLPLIALLRADGKYLSTIMVPEHLLEEVKKAILTRLGGEFEEFVFSFPEVSAETSLKDFKKLREDLEDTIASRGCVLVTPNQRHALLNAFTALNETFRKNQSEKVFLKLQTVAAILKIIKEREAIIGDEVDDLLKLNLQYIISLGEPTKLPETESLVVEGIYTRMLTLLQRKNISPPFLADAKTGGKFISQEFYDAHILKDLATHAADLLLKSKEPAAAAACQHIGQKHLITYLTTRYKNDDNKQQVTDLEKLIGDQEAVREQIAGLRGLLLHMIPESINNHVNVDYGVSPEQISPFAVPFSTPGIAAKTQFSHPYDLLLKTLQTYSKQPIPIKFIESVQKENKQALEYIVGKEHLSRSEKIAKILLYDQKRRMRFIEKFILPQVKYNKESIESDSHALFAASLSFSGFSGTIYNLMTMPRFADDFPDSATEAALLNRLKEKAGKEGGEIIQVAPPTTRSIESLLEGIKKTPQCCAFIDSGGWLSSNTQEFAKKILDQCKEEQGNKITHVFYYDEKGDLLSFPQGKKVEEIKEENRFTIYDMPRAVGANISQIPEGRAVMTIDRRMILRDFLQAIYRMRKIKDGNQGATLLYDDEVKGAVSSMIHREDEKANLSYSELMRFFITNQVCLVKTDIYPALQRRMRAQVQEKIRETLIEKLTQNDPKGLNEFFENTRSFLITDRGNAWSQFGAIPSKVQKEHKITSDVKDWEQKLQKAGLSALLPDVKGCCDKKIFEELDVKLDSCDSERSGMQAIDQARAVDEVQLIAKNLQEIQQQDEKVAQIRSRVGELRAQATVLGVNIDLFNQIQQTKETISQDEKILSQIEQRLEKEEHKLRVSLTKKVDEIEARRERCIAETEKFSKRAGSLGQQGIELSVLRRIAKPQVNTSDKNIQNKIAQFDADVRIEEEKLLLQTQLLDKDIRQQTETLQNAAQELTTRASNIGDQENKSKLNVIIKDAAEANLKANLAKIEQIRLEISEKEILLKKSIEDAQKLLKEEIELLNSCGFKEIKTLMEKEFSACSLTNTKELNAFITKWTPAQSKIRQLMSKKQEALQEFEKAEEKVKITFGKAFDQEQIVQNFLKELAADKEVLHQWQPKTFDELAFPLRNQEELLNKKTETFLRKVQQKISDFEAKLRVRNEQVQNRKKTLELITRHIPKIPLPKPQQKWWIENIEKQDDFDFMVINTQQQTEVHRFSVLADGSLKCGDSTAQNIEELFHVRTDDSMLKVLWDCQEKWVEDTCLTPQSIEYIQQISPKSLDAPYFYIEKKPSEYTLHYAGKESNIIFDNKKHLLKVNVQNELITADTVDDLVKTLESKNLTSAYGLKQTLESVIGSFAVWKTLNSAQEASKILLNNKQLEGLANTTAVCLWWKDKKTNLPFLTIRKGTDILQYKIRYSPSAKNIELWRPESSEPIMKFSRDVEKPELLNNLKIVSKSEIIFQRPEEYEKPTGFFKFW